MEQAEVTLAFYIAAAVMLLAGIGVVVNRNPVSAAFCLVVSFIGLAALFISLNAYFIGIIQILVYAGAVMVLFLFIIMLLDIKAETKRKINYYSAGGAFALVALFVAQITAVLDVFETGKKEMPELAGDKGSDVAAVGELLFTDFIFHLQIVGVLLLVATVGVIVLSKRDAPPDPAPDQ
ncbi:MAG: NADH-quinone oxidoreductase subunit J [Verrucomicrobiota bacterium]